jgi:hypothetical protein
MSEGVTNNLMDAAQANTLAAVQRQVQDWNNVLKSNYLTAFDNWSQSVLAGRTDNSNPPQPPKAYVVGHFTDPTSGPGSLGPYGDTAILWPYPMQGTEPVCPMPPVPAAIKPYTPPVIPEPDNIRNVPSGDAMPVGYRVKASDGGVWQKQSSPTPFGVVYYYMRVA